ALVDGVFAVRQLDVFRDTHVAAVFRCTLGGVGAAFKARAWSSPRNNGVLVRKEVEVSIGCCLQFSAGVAARFWDYVPLFAACVGVSLLGVEQPIAFIRHNVLERPLAKYAVADGGAKDHWAGFIQHNMLNENAAGLFVLDGQVPIDLARF